MPSIPLPFVVSLVLGLVLLRMIRQEGRFGLFPLLVAAFAVQSALSGLNWSVGWPAARLVQPILAAVLPGLSYAAFEQLRRGDAVDVGRLWPHLGAAVVVAALVAVWREPIDLVLFATYAGYGLALLRLAARGLRPSRHRGSATSGARTGRSPFSASFSSSPPSWTPPSRSTCPSATAARPRSS